MNDGFLSVTSKSTQTHIEILAPGEHEDDDDTVWSQAVSDAPSQYWEEIDDLRLTQSLTAAPQPPRAVHHSRTTRRSAPSRAARRFRGPPRPARPAPPKSIPCRKPPVGDETNKRDFQERVREAFDTAPNGV